MTSQAITQQLVAEIQRSIGAATAKAQQSANIANSRAIDAAASAASVAASVSNAQLYSQNASASASSAAASAAQFSAQLSTLTAAVSGAQTSASQSASSASSAISAATAAQVSSNSAAASANTATSAAATAQGYVATVAASQSAANTYANNSANSATASAASAAAALVSQNAAASSATASAASALASAQTFNGTSTTSLTIGMGTISLATQAGKAWVPGQVVSVANSNNAGMVGVIASYDSVGGLMTASISSYRGAGTFTSWNIGLSPSTSAAAPGSIGYIKKSSNYQAFTWDGVLADSSGGAFTVTAPPNPNGGDKFEVADVTGYFSMNNLTVVSTDGVTFAGQVSPMILDVSNIRVTFVYDGTTWQMLMGLTPTNANAVSTNGAQAISNKTITNSIISANQLTSLADALLNGVTVGLGNGQNVTNLMVGGGSFLGGGGSSNTAIGYNALGSLTTGIGNVALGNGAGSNITTGRYNVVLGNYATTTGVKNNWIYLADGQGNLRMTINSTGSTVFNGTIFQNTTNQVLDTSNYAAYALPLVGGGAVQGDVNVTGTVQAGVAFKFPDGSTQTTAAVGNATGGGTDKLFYNNVSAMTASYAIPANTNSMVAGPVRMSVGVTLTIPAGSRLRVF